MRTLVLLRGAPGSGKSTFIREHHLEQFALSADTIRLQYLSPRLDINGHFYIESISEKDVWNLLMKMLETRMKDGSFTIIDATNTRNEDINKYIKLSLKYRYSLYMIDMGDLPIEECKLRNRLREEYKQVPDNIIDIMYGHLKRQIIDIRVNVLKPQDLNVIFYKTKNYNRYQKIIHIGDIKSPTLLATTIGTQINGQYFNNPKNLYIFCGDYLTIDMLLLLIKICKCKNVVIVEGKYIYDIENYMNNQNKSLLDPITQRLNQAIQENEFTLRDLRMLCRKTKQVILYTYYNKKVLVSHGALSHIKPNLLYIPTSQIINGVGDINNYLDILSAFEENTDKYTYQINCYSNTTSIHPIDRCYNLKGNDRILYLDKDGFK